MEVTAYDVYKYLLDYLDTKLDSLDFRYNKISLPILIEGVGKVYVTGEERRYKLLYKYNGPNSIDLYYKEGVDYVKVTRHNGIPLNCVDTLVNFINNLEQHYQSSLKELKGLEKEMSKEHNEVLKQLKAKLKN